MVLKQELLVIDIEVKCKKEITYVGQTIYLKPN